MGACPRPFVNPPVAPHDRLVAKLSSIADLSREAKALLRELPLRIVSFEKNTDLVRQGDRPHECALLIEGVVARYKLLGAGQRQIMSFHTAGDIPDLQSLHLPRMDHSVAAITPSLVGFIPHAAVNELIRVSPELAGVLWRDTLIDAAIFREWLAGVGRRTAHQRIAHLICEIFVRTRAVGLADGGSFQFPVTQVEIADSLGLSAVHVNRVLQDLRREELIIYSGGSVVIKNWPRLQARADFDAEYLHLRAGDSPWT
jgi:CRP-like cAMP-binding protein